MNEVMSVPRIYLDTSVIGGYFDEEFALATRRLFREIGRGRFKAIISDVTLQELEPAPEKVRRLARRMTGRAEILMDSEESQNLALAYQAARIVSNRFFVDCRHVALATVGKVELLVSWNFRHIVRYDHIRRFNEVNRREGYAILDIRSPREVTPHDR